MADADALRASHGQLPAVLLSRSSILIAVDQAGLVLLWNAAAVQAFGPSEEQTLDRPFSRCGIAWDWERIESLAPGGISARAQRIVQPFTRPDGGAGTAMLQLNPQFTTGGEVTGCVWLGSDSGSAVVSGGRGFVMRRPVAAKQQPTQRTPLPEEPAQPAASDSARLYPVHLSFLDSHLVSLGEDPTQWRLLSAEECRLDEQGMEVRFTLGRRQSRQDVMCRRILIASGELLGISEG
jgi:PAS domain-containing protein